MSNMMFLSGIVSTILIDLHHFEETFWLFQNKLRWEWCAFVLHRNSLDIPTIFYSKPLSYFKFCSHITASNNGYNKTAPNKDIHWVKGEYWYARKATGHLFVKECVYTGLQCKCERLSWPLLTLQPLHTNHSAFCLNCFLSAQVSENSFCPFWQHCPCWQMAGIWWPLLTPGTKSCIWEWVVMTLSDQTED